MPVLLQAILLATLLLLIGFALRAGVKLFRVLYIPAAALAGVLGFALVQAALHLEGVAGVARPIAAELGSWPGWLIAVVFAGLLLERSSGGGFRAAVARGARSGILAWIIILGQIAIGLVVYLLLVRPVNPGVTASFGQLLEVSWAGGHGTSAAMAEVYRTLGFVEGRDLAFFLATLGLIWGVVSGLVLVNLALRRGWTAGGMKVQSERSPAPTNAPLGNARSRTEVLDPLTLQVLWLALAFAIGYAFRALFIAIAGVIVGGNDPAISGEAIDFIANIPLFLFTLLGGLTLRITLDRMGRGELIDGASIQRLIGVAIEFMIVAAIATMRVEALQTYFLPVLALFLLAAIWCAVCLLVLAPRLLPKAYWFELGLLNYGFATANTPQGFMLLRIVDPELKTRAAEDYAIAAPLSAPFVGGGVLTILAFPLLLQQVHAGIFLLILIIAIVALYLAGRRIARGHSPES